MSWRAPRLDKSTGVQAGKRPIWECLPIGSVEGCLWVLVLFGHSASWFWRVSDVEDRLWATSVIWAFCQLVLTSTIEDRLFWGNVCLRLHTGHPQRGSRTDQSSGVCMYIPFVWLVFLLPCGKFSFNSFGKILAVNLWLKKKDNFFWTIYGYSILQTLEKIDQDESLEIPKKPVLFAYVVAKI